MAFTISGRSSSLPAFSQPARLSIRVPARGQELARRAKVGPERFAESQYQAKA